MTTLIDKLRAAETGSPELSAEVLAEFWPDFLWEPINKFNTGGGYKLSQDRKLEKKPWLDVTQSIDAALTLVPEGYSFISESFSDGYAFQLYDCSDWAVSTARHKSLPIAICIAVLSIPENKRGV